MTNNKYEKLSDVNGKPSSKKQLLISMWNAHHSRLLSLVLLVLTCSMMVNAATTTQEFAITVPNIRPDHPDQYLCMAARLPVDLDGQYIVGIKPHGNSKRVHHMLLYGCPQPGVYERDTPNYVWDCSGMHVSSDETNDDDDRTVDYSYRPGPICAGEPHILYGWALDAPALKMPPDVGFKVGGLDTDIHFLVVQVHYGHTHIFHKNPDLTDNSGLVLELVPNLPESGITKQAGVLLLASLGQVKQGKSRHEIYCDIKDDIEMHPFRFRVHTHKLGTEVLGAKLSNSWSDSVAFNTLRSGENRIIGKGDPQKPQMFNEVKEKALTIRKGDTVYAYCEFNNNKTHIVNIGQTGDDEMCNFYLMYWTDSQKLLSKSTCYNVNPPHFPRGFSDLG